MSDTESFDFGCMAIGNVDNASPASDKICVGSQQGVIRIYNPQRPEFRVEDLVLEEDLSHPILQLLVGSFLPAAPDALAVAVLHPRKLSVFEVIAHGSKEKKDKVDYYYLSKAYHHDLGVDGLHFTAYNMTSGCFGGAQGREMFIVQSMDGKLQILEQSANAFSRQLVDYLVPGPLQYLPKIDAFVTVNQANTAECYRYHVLASSQAAGNKNSNDAKGESKKSSSSSSLIPPVRSAMHEWALQLGEQARQILVGSFSATPELTTAPGSTGGAAVDDDSDAKGSVGPKTIQVGSKNNNSHNDSYNGSPSELLVVCDKSLFLVRGESGAVIQQRRVERADVSCVCAFPGPMLNGAPISAAEAARAAAGSSNSNSHNVRGRGTNFLLAGMDATIQVYSGFQLLWAAKATTVPVQMAVSSNFAK